MTVAVKFLASKHKAILSNRLERLYLQFRQHCFSPLGHPFDQRIVIVPYGYLKDWLLMRLAKDVGQIAMGLHILPLDAGIQAVFNTLNVSSLNKGKIPSSLDLLFGIEAALTEILSEEAFSTQEHNECDLDQSIAHSSQQESLFHLLGMSPGQKLNHSRDEMRLHLAAKMLAKLFTTYGIYSTSLVQKWEEEGKLTTSWQAQVWNKLFLNTGWIYPAKLLQQDCVNQDNVRVQVHLFGMTSLCPLYHAYLKGISAVVPVMYYILSPCCVYWADALSDKEAEKLHSFWIERSTNKDALLQMEQLVYDRNPLLANHGRLARRLAFMMEEDTIDTVEDYTVPSLFLHLPQYSDFIPDYLDREEDQHSEDVWNVLNAVQADLLLSRSKSDNLLELKDEDSSIQIHACPTLLREIEVLYQRILDSYKDYSQPLGIAEILVLAPDLEKYEPYIQRVFGRSTHPITHQIVCSNSISGASLAHAFLKLLDLPKHRFRADALLELFYCISFQRKLGLKYEEFKIVLEWFESGCFRWGLDSQHRDTLLQKEGFLPTKETSSSGTWQQLEKNLILQWISTDKRNEDSKEIRLDEPLQMDSSSVLLLGECAVRLRKLRHCLENFENQKRTLAEWADQFDQLLDEMFAIDLGSHLEKYEYAQCKELIFNLKRTLRDRSQVQFNYYSVKSVLADLLSSIRHGDESHLQASVIFAPIHMMRSYPSSMICLIGMNEDSFPRQEPKGWNLLFQSSEQDSCPTIGDIDRLMFLETILSARERLYISYQGYSFEERAIRPPSHVVAEFLKHMDANYLIAGMPPSQKILVRHPARSYDPQCFSIENSSCRSFNEIDYSLAKQQEKWEPNPFFVKEGSSKHTQWPQEVIIDLQDLKQLAAHPLKFYFTKNMGIYLSPFRKIHSEDALALPSYDMSRLRLYALKMPWDKLCKMVETSWNMPSGVWKKVALKRLEQEVFQLKQACKELNLEGKEPFSCELRLDCIKSKKIADNSWVVPALCFELDKENLPKKIYVKGKIDSLIGNGLLSFDSTTQESVLKKWPEILLWKSHQDISRLIEGNSLYFIKKPAEKLISLKEPIEALRKYLEYYITAHQTASCLFPKAVGQILNQNKEGFYKALQQQSNPYHLGKDPYLEFYLQRTPQDYFDDMWEIWQRKAHELFSDLKAENVEQEAQ